MEQNSCPQTAKNILLPFSHSEPVYIAVLIGSSAFTANLAIYIKCNIQFGASGILLTDI